MSKKADLEALKLELQDLRQCIKQETNALQHSDNEIDHFQDASEQLSSITEATHKAADAIMESAEQSDANILALRSIVGNNTEAERVLDQMTANTQKMYEACTFQDITGQRVSKVKNSLGFIEERIHSIVLLLDGGSPVNTKLDAPGKTEDEKLLNGPQLEGGGLKQSDVDALFD